MRLSKVGVGMLVVAGLVVLSTGCAQSEKCNVTVSYVLEPSAQVPEGLNTLAILDAGVKLDGSEDDDRSKKWAKISADLMEAMIQDSAKKFDSGLTVSSRRQTAKVMAEKDMKMAGLVQGGAAAQAAKLLDVQALITSQLNIRVEVKKSKKTTFDITSLAGGGGHGWGWGAGTMGAREADQISRNMTLQCKYNMIDATTGEVLFDYSPKPFRKLDSKKPSPLFGRSSGEADLDPVDEYIGELVEQGTREFVSTFVPCEVTYSYELSSGDSEESAEGILAIRMDEYETALAQFKKARAEEPNDHCSVFAMGVVSEKLKDWDNALKYYRQAAGMRGLDDEEIAKYTAAKRRVAAHVDRIRK